MKRAFCKQKSKDSNRVPVNRASAHRSRKENTKHKILKRVIELGGASRTQLDSRNAGGVASQMTILKRLPELVEKGYLERSKNGNTFIYKPTVRAKLRVFGASELLKKQGLAEQEAKRLAELLGDLEESSERNAELWVERIKRKLKGEGIAGISRLTAEARTEAAEKSVAKRVEKEKDAGVSAKMPFSKLTRKIYSVVYGEGGGTIASIAKAVDENPKKVGVELCALEKAGKIRSVQIGGMKIYRPPKGMLVMGKRHRESQAREVPKFLGTRARAEFEEKKRRYEELRETHRQRLPQAEVEKRVREIQEIRERRHDIGLLLERLSPEQPLPDGKMGIILRETHKFLSGNSTNMRRVNALGEAIDRLSRRRFPTHADILSIRNASAEMGVIASKIIGSLVKAGVSPGKWEKD